MFCGIFIAFLESTLILKILKKKKKKEKWQPHGLTISEVIDSERCTYLNA